MFLDEINSVLCFICAHSKLIVYKIILELSSKTILNSVFVDICIYIFFNIKMGNALTSGKYFEKT